MNTYTELLRHYVAALAYRLDKVLVNAPQDFGALDLGGGVRTPAGILAHVGDVLVWASGRLTGAAREPHSPGTWSEETVRVGAIIATLDSALVEGKDADAATALKLLQGPLADAMTHVGQLAMQCRIAGRPIPGENFYEAPIAALGTEP